MVGVCGVCGKIFETPAEASHHSHSSMRLRLYRFLHPRSFEEAVGRIWYWGGIMVVIYAISSHFFPIPSIDPNLPGYIVAMLMGTVLMLLGINALKQDRIDTLVLERKHE